MSEDKARAEEAPAAIEQDLLHQIVFAQLNNSHSSWQALVESLQYDLNRQRATVELIRERIGDLLDSPFAPGSHSIASALYPAAEAVEALAKAYEDKETGR